MSTSISIHRIAKLTIQPTRQLDISNRGLVFFRTLRIETDEGTFTIDLFAEDPNNLKLEGDDA